MEGSAGLCSVERSHSAASPVALRGLGVSLSGPSSSASIRFRGSTFGRLSWSAGGVARREDRSESAAPLSGVIEVLASIAVGREVSGGHVRPESWSGECEGMCGLG